MRARNWLMNNRWVIFRPDEISVHSQPMQLASLPNLIFPNGRNIIFRDTRYKAGIATSALVKVDNHSPLITAGVVGALMGLVVECLRWRMRNQIVNFLLGSALPDGFTRVVPVLNNTRYRKIRVPIDKVAGKNPDVL